MRWVLQKEMVTQLWQLHAALETCGDLSYRVFVTLSKLHKLGFSLVVIDEIYLIF